MPIFIEDRELKLPEEIPVAREAFGVEADECFGCFLGDCDPEMHDRPATCEYAGGYIYSLEEI
jgi:hypothetical protein